MKRISMLVCLLLVCAMVFSACSKTEPQEQQPEDSAVQQDQEPDSKVEQKTADVHQPEGAGEAAELPEQEVPEEITEPEEPEETDLPYTLQLRAEVSVFDGPGYDNGYARAVGEDGVYTIVEERTDEEGSLWGKLKSGVGWVNLTDAAHANARNTPIAACFADALVLHDGQYSEHIVEDSEYTVKIAFRANEDLHAVTFCSLQYGENTYEITETFFTEDELQEDTYLVVGVVFYGDMTTYGVSFLDRNGAEHHYAISMSGRNGELEWNEYEV